MNNGRGFRNYRVVNFMFPELEIQECRNKPLTESKVCILPNFSLNFTLECVIMHNITFQFVEEIATDWANKMSIQASRELETTLYPDDEVDREYGNHLPDLNSCAWNHENLREKFLDIGLVSEFSMLL